MRNLREDIWKIIEAVSEKHTVIRRLRLSVHLRKGSALFDESGERQRQLELQQIEKEIQLTVTKISQAYTQVGVFV